MAFLWEYLGAWASTTKGLYHLNGWWWDDSWNAVNLTPTNINWVSGKLWSGSASFNGTNSFLNRTLNSGLSSSFYFRFWIKTNTSAYQSLIHSHVASYNNLWTNVAVDSWWKIRFQMFDWTNNPLVDSTIFINDNNWHLITCERNVINDKLRIYIDGNYNNETTDTTTSTPTYSVFNIWVRWDWTKTWWYNWLMDEIIINSTTTSPIEEKKHYTFARWLYIL